MRNRLLFAAALVTSVTLAACGRDADETAESREYGSVNDSALLRDTMAGRPAPAPAPSTSTRRTPAPAPSSPAADADAERRAREAREAADRERKAADERERARANALRLETGTTITLRNDNTVSSRHQAVGGRVTATSTTDVLDTRNRVVIPAGTKFLGTIKELESATGNNDTAKMHIEFNAIEVNGDAIPLIAATENMEVVARGRGVTAEQAGKVGAGTVIGGVAGRVIGGNTRGAVVGAVIGTAAGVVVANSTRETDIVLDRGAGITLRLTAPFEQRVVAVREN